MALPAKVLREVLAAFPSAIVVDPANTPLGRHLNDLMQDPSRINLKPLKPNTCFALSSAMRTEMIEGTVMAALKRGADVVVLDPNWFDHREAYATAIAAHASAPIVVHRRVQARSATSGQPIRADADTRIRHRIVVGPPDAASITKSLKPDHPCVERRPQKTSVLPKPKPIQLTIPLEHHSQIPHHPKRVRAPFGRNVKTTVVFDTYWRFAAERQRIFFQRLSGQTTPWTIDPILRAHKFTNAYRASDRTSQYLIRHVIYRDDLPSSAQEVVFRILLFKLFNRIGTWQLLEGAFGALTYQDFAFNHYDRVLSQALAEGQRIYSAAYIMPPGTTAFGERQKHKNHLKLIECMMRDMLPQRLADARSMAAAFELLRSYPTIGNFIAYQLVTDINYSAVTDFGEMEFVMPGPGALDGIRKCFANIGDYTESDIIRMVAEQQFQHFDSLGLTFQTLFGRPLQLIDCQNLFCEVDKYARVAHPEFVGRTGRSRIKQMFSPVQEPIKYFYPPQWGLNNAVRSTPRTSVRLTRA